MRGVVLGVQCTELERARSTFEQFCQFIHATFTTIPADGALEILAIQFIPSCAHSLLCQAVFWDTPTWGELCDAMCARKSGRGSKLRKVSFELEFEPIPEEHQPSAILKIKQQMSQLTPDVDIVISFSPLPQPEDN